MIEIGPGAWHVHGPDFRLPLGARLPLCSTVLRLADATLLVYAPADFDDATVHAINARGDVSHVVGPNLLHHTFIGPALARWPRAAFHAPARLAAKRPDLPAPVPLDPVTDAALRDTVDVIPLAGAPAMDETLLFHRPSGTLVVGDLVFNVTEPANFMSKLVLAVMGAGDRTLAQSRAWKRLAKDRTAMRATLDRVLALPIAHVAPCHGPHVDIDAAAFAVINARAYGELPPAARR